MNRSARTTLALASAATCSALALTVLDSPARAGSAEIGADPNSAISLVDDAFERAWSTGYPVEIGALRDEYTKTYANPDGESMTQEIASAALHGTNEDGALVPIDTELRRWADGSIRPTAAAVDLALPNADDPRISMGYRGRDLRFDLPGDLAEPVLDGDTATYVGVFPGVDLRLTATPEGLRHVYVVSTREAAESAALRELRLGITASDGVLQPRAGGGSMFVDSLGEVVFASAPALMWDSSGMAPRAAAGAPLDETTMTRSMAVDSSVGESATGPGGPLVPQHEAPSDGDQWVEMKVRVGPEALRVTPDAEMLSDPDTVFPVYIDPYQAIDRGERLMLRSDGYSQWQFNDDEGMGRCPTSYSNECSGPYTKRLFYEFGRGGLNRGDRVMHAEFAVRETHAVNCTPTAVELKQTDAVSSASSWPGPAVRKSLGSQSVAHGRSGCPAAEVAFANAGLRDSARDLADGTLGRLTLSLRAGNESNQLAWKRFSDAAVLRVRFVREPGVPTNVGINTPSAGLVCRREQNNPALVATVSPTFRAQLQVLVQPPANGAQGALRARYQVQRKVAGGWEAAMPERWRPALAEPFGTDDQSTSLDLGDLPKSLDAGVLHRFRVLTESHYNIPEVGEGQLSSDWSAWCHFTIDPDRPAAPLVESSDGIYEEEINGNILWGGGPGITGGFRYRPNPDDNDPNIQTYSTRLTADGGSVRPLATGSRVTPTDPGPHTLYVAAIDRLGRNSFERSYRFNVADPPPVVAYWHVGESSGTTIVDSGASGQPLHLSSEDLLAPAGFGRRGDVDAELDGTYVPDRALTFAGTGAATSTAPVIPTGESFSASAWVYLSDATTDRTFLSQASTDGSRGLDLRYDHSANSWAAVWTYTEGGVKKEARAAAAVPAVGEVWTQVSVTFDAQTRDLKLFLNGRESASVALTGAAVPTATDGVLTIGRAVAGRPFRGLVDEIWVRREAAQASTIASAGAYDEAGRPLLSLVASWDPARAASSSTVADKSVFARAAMNLENAKKDANSAHVVLNGEGGLATSGPVLDETGSFTVSADLLVDPEAMANRGGDARVIGQQGDDGHPSWALWFLKTGTVDGRATGVWSFGRWSEPDRTTVHARTAPENEWLLPDTLGNQVRINIVHDTLRQAICLYHGAEELGCAEYAAPSQGLGEITAGMSPSGSGRTDFLIGNIRCLSAWAGAANQDQLNTLPACG